LKTLELLHPLLGSKRNVGCSMNVGARDQHECHPPLKCNTSVLLCIIQVSNECDSKLW